MVEPLTSVRNDGWVGDGLVVPTAIARKIRLGSDRELTYAALVIVAGVLATTLAQTQVLARLPLQNLLKNELHVDRTANAAFFSGQGWLGI